MIDLQLYLAIGLPCLTILTSLVISLIQISAIREDTRVQIASIREDIREIRSDLKLLTGKVYEMIGQH